MSGTVYSLCDRDGVVLYVGQTRRANPGHRFVEHMQTKPWAGEIASFNILQEEIPDELLDFVEDVYAGALAPKYGNWSFDSMVTSRPDPRPDTPSRNRRFPIVYLRREAPTPRICNQALRAEMRKRRLSSEDMAMALGSPLSFVRQILNGGKVACDRRTFEVLQVRFGMLPSEIACVYDHGSVTA